MFSNNIIIMGFYLIALYIAHVITAIEINPTMSNASNGYAQASFVIAYITIKTPTIIPIAISKDFTNLLTSIFIVTPPTLCLNMNPQHLQEYLYYIQ